MYELVYSSKIRPEVSDSEVETLVDAARRRNDKTAITSSLVFNGNKFYQMIEGEELAVNDLFDHIVNDKRHSDISVYYIGPKAERSVPQHSMFFQRRNEDSDLRNLVFVDTDIPSSAVIDNSMGIKVFDILPRL